MSIIGDELTVVTYVPSVGSSLDTNRHDHLPLGDTSIDGRADLVAEAAIRRSVSGADTTMLVAADKSLYTGQDSLLESKQRLGALIDQAGANLKGEGPRYLVLISKYRSDGRLKVSNGTIGSGMLSGLGFYLDYQHRMTQTSTGASGRGFIAPYAYITITLIDLATGSVVRTLSTSESTSIATARNPDTTDPWEVLPAAQKVRILDNLVRRGIDRLMPQVVAPG